MAVEKITMSVKVGLTDREAADLEHLCAIADRSPSEYIRILLLRPHMYGILHRTSREIEGRNSDFGSL